MGKVLILQNDALFTGGTFEQELARRQISFEYYSGVELGAPSLEKIKQLSGLIILGGPRHFRVTDAEKSPNLSKIIFFLRACLEQHLPIIAVGQGSQLLAQAQGAWVERISQPQIGWIQAEVYPDYSRNSVIFSKVEEKKFPVFAWFDTINGFPPQGYWYLYHPHCRYLSTGIHGNCYLFNFHPEITVEMVEKWVGTYSKELDHLVNPNELIEQTKKNFEYTKKFSRKIIHAFESFLK